MVFMNSIYPEKRLEELVSEVRKRASNSPYRGCAPAVFTAIIDVLGLAYGDEAFRAIIGLSGGTGHLTKGTCGALSGAVAAISLSYNKSREETERIIEDAKELHPADPYIPKFYQEMFDKTAKIAKRMYAKYGGITCIEIQFNLYGKGLNLLIPEKHWEFVQSFESQVVNCFTVAEDVAGWTVEVLLEDQAL